MSRHLDFIIIGSGPAGCSGAVYAGRANKSAILFTGASAGGHLTTTTEVYNYTGYVKIDGPELMNAMMAQVEMSNVQVQYEVVTKVNFSMEINIKLRKHEVISATGATYTAPIVIIATGAKHKHLPLNNAHIFNNKGLYYCATCDGILFRNDDLIVVVGGGNTALTEALYLSAIGKKVIIIHRRDEFRGEPFLAKEVSSKNNIEILWNHEVVELCGESHLQYINVINNKTQVITKLFTRAVFIAIGFNPNTQIFNSTPLHLLEGGYIAINHENQTTNVPGVYAAGDVADLQFKQAITAAGDGAKAAIHGLMELNRSA